MVQSVCQVDSGSFYTRSQGLGNFRGEEGCAVPANICNLYLYILHNAGLRYWLLERASAVFFCLFVLTIAIVINHYNEENMK